MGRYESWYLRAVHPERPIGIWIRHTTHLDKAGRLSGAYWFTLFEPHGVTARKLSLPHAPEAGGDRFTAAAQDAAWDIAVTGLAPELRHYASPWMYRARLPKTKPVSVYPVARMDGSVSVEGRTISLEGWRGMVGHNWGAEHAHRWIWLHCAGFVEEPEAWIDLVIGRLKIGPVVTPWVANGALFTPGRLRRLGGLGRRAIVREQVGAADITVRGKGCAVSLRTQAPTKAANVLWRYADPAGGQHVAANCSIAEMSLRLTEGPRAVQLSSEYGAAYELGMAEAPDGYEIQPYPDP